MVPQLPWGRRPGVCCGGWASSLPAAPQAVTKLLAASLVLEAFRAVGRRRVDGTSLTRPRHLHTGLLRLVVVEDERRPERLLATPARDPLPRDMSATRPRHVHDTSAQARDPLPRALYDQRRDCGCDAAAARAASRRDARPPPRRLARSCRRSVVARQVGRRPLHRRRARQEEGLGEGVVEGREESRARREERQRHRQRGAQCARQAWGCEAVWLSQRVLCVCVVRDAAPHPHADRRTRVP